MQLMNTEKLDRFYHQELTFAMIDEVQKIVQDGVPQVDEVVVPDVPQAEKLSAAATVAKEPPPIPESGEKSIKPNKVEEVLEAKKALEELKQLVQEALNKHEFGGVAMPQQLEAAKEDLKKEVAVTEDESAKEEAKDEVVTDKPPKLETETETVDGTNDLPEKEENIYLVEPEDIEVKAATATACSDTVEDDGAKNVEAIEETIVSVTSSVQPVQTTAAKETAEEKADVVSEDKRKDAKTEDKVPPEEISIWGIPLLADERSEVILKFLRARDFKVKVAFATLKNTILWRKEFGIDELVEQDLGDDLEKVVFMHGFDKDGHPVCYNVYGEFQNKELYQKTFSDEEKRQKFHRWRIQFLEKSIRKLDFSPGGICTIVQVNDLKNSPGPTKWELRQATKRALELLQDNYPEFVARQVFINVPWWYLAVNKMISPFLTQRTRSKFVFAGPSKSAETLFRYIAAEQVPVKYGGLTEDGEFANTDAVTEITVKAAAKHKVEFPVTGACLLTWEVRVIGWDVSYGAEFVPSAKDSYTVIIQKARKVASAEEPVVCNNFKIGEPGKVVLSIDNPTSKKKKLLYRLKTNPTSD
ncbi:hypothetical protein CRYUN_Cryun24cG0078200 [Craigia yunnanensis]